MILEISDDGVCLDVGALSVPKIFGLAFTAGGEVLRVCWLTWRRGELIGARFLTAKELRQGVPVGRRRSERPGCVAERADGSGFRWGGM